MFQNIFPELKTFLLENRVNTFQPDILETERLDCLEKDTRIDEKTWP